MKKASQRLMRPFRPSGPKKHVEIHEEAALDTSASGSSTPRHSQLDSSEANDKAEARAFSTFSEPQPSPRPEMAASGADPPGDAGVSENATDSGAEPDQKMATRADAFPSDSSFNTWAPGAEREFSGRTGIEEKPGAPQIPETAEEGEEGEVSSSVDFSFAKGQNSEAPTPRVGAAAAAAADEGKDGSAASDSRQNAARSVEEVVTSNERMMRAQRPLLVKVTSLAPSGARQPADAGSPASDADSKFRRMRSTPVSQVANSPINPGSPSIYKTWPPKEPAPGYSPTKRPGSAQGPRPSFDGSWAGASRLSSTGKSVNFRSSSLESKRAEDNTDSSPADSSENDYPGEATAANGTFPRTNVPIFASSDPNLGMSTAGDGRPTEFISLRRRPPPEQNPFFNVSDGGGQPGNGDSPKSLSPVSPGPGAINPWATGSGPPAASSGQPAQPGQASAARRGSSEGRGGAAFSIVPWLVFFSLMVLLWGLRESNQVDHLKRELTLSREKHRNLTRYLRTLAKEQLPAQSCPASYGTGTDTTASECQSRSTKAGDAAPGAQEGWLEDDEEETPGGVFQVDHLQLRRLAFFLLAVALVIPILLVYYMDDLPDLFSWLGVSQPQQEAGAGAKVTLSKRLAYKVDVWFSTNSWVKSAALLVATLILIAYGGLALYAVSGEEGLPLIDATWRAWTYVADAGNHADSSGLGPRIVSVCISFGGMLVFALMVGLVTESISEKVDSLRKGKSDVIERNHTLVLGWNDKLGSLIKQLIMANESAGGGVVVVMAEREKEDMESDIQKMELDMRGTAVICRSGSALVPADLKKVNVTTARAIVVLAAEENADASDAHAMRVVLSLGGLKEGLRGHIVVELSDVDSDQLVKMVGGQNVETVVAHDVIGRMMIQCARQPGLAQIWETLLGFEHCEFYSKAWPQLEGATFRDALLSFPEAVPIGLKVQGYTVLNPNDDYVLQPGDEVLVIAEDDDSYAPQAPATVREAELPAVALAPKIPEKILFCGWRRDIDDMIVVLEAFLAKGSELWIFSDVPVDEREQKLVEGGLNPSDLVNVRLVHRLGNAVIRRHLEALPMETFDSILILADERHEDSVTNCDSRSLATLLLIRDIQSKRIRHTGRGSRASYPRMVTEKGGRPQTPNSWVRQMQSASQTSIVISEILDSRTRSLVPVSRISDYVLSNELVSMALAMVAEDRSNNQVLAELFAEEGNEMYIRPAELYIDPGEQATFFDLMARARQRKEIMIGYKDHRDEAGVINPPNKNDMITWTSEHSFIVLSFEE